MFDDYADSQDVAYTLLKNSLNSNRLSHAYLINANYAVDVYQFVDSFVCSILCPHHFTNDSNCKNCSCTKSHIENNLEFKVIESETNVIKKEQLLELQSEFTRSSLNGGYRVYLIKDCDKMNKHASNSLLKFLEEPVSGVIAILVTNNMNRLLDTIVSRCQVINYVNHHNYYLNGGMFERFSSLFCNSKIEIDSFFNDENKKELVQSAVSFFDYYEENHFDILIFMKKMCYNRFKSKEEVLVFFFVMLYFYYDILRVKCQLECIVFFENIDLLKSISKKYTIDVLVKKIKLALYGLDMIKCNLNANLLIDDVVIKLGELDECC